MICASPQFGLRICGVITNSSHLSSLDPRRTASNGLSEHQPAHQANASLGCLTQASEQKLATLGSRVGGWKNECTNAITVRAGGADARQQPSEPDTSHTQGQAVTRHDAQTNSGNPAPFQGQAIPHHQTQDFEADSS